MISALKAHPYLNAVLEDADEEIVLRKYYNIGIAVDVPDGLIVPVVKFADQKTVFEIAADIAALAAAARGRTLDLADLKGGTFSVTNVGMLGGEAATPIINYPEVAILATMRIAERVRVAGGVPAVRTILPLCLSFDHRVIDGAEAARFMNDLKAALEDESKLRAALEPERRSSVLGHDHIVDQARGAEIDGQGDEPAGPRVRGRLERFGVHDFDVVDAGGGFAAEEAADEAGHGVRTALSGPEDGFRLGQAAAERYGGPAVRRAEIFVARAEGQSVGLAHDGPDLDPDAEVEIAGHPLQDEGLLGVLPAEISRVRPDDFEQLEDDGADAAEMARPGLPAKLVLQAFDLDVRAKAGRIHVSRLGREKDIRPLADEQGRVAFEVPRIAGRNPPPGRTGPG